MTRVCVATLATIGSTESSTASVVFHYDGIINTTFDAPGWPLGNAENYAPSYFADNGFFSFRIDLPDPQYVLSAGYVEPPISAPLPPNQKYRLSVTFGTKPVSAQAKIAPMVWEDFYYNAPDGTAYRMGGYDNLEVPFYNNLPTQIAGNTVIADLNEIYTFGLSCCGGTAFDTDFEWLDSFGIDAQLPSNAVGQPYTIILATLPDVLTGVPEPETWALLVLGFAAAGAALRRKGRRRGRTPDLCHSANI